MASLPAIADGNMFEDIISVEGLELGVRLINAAIAERKRTGGDDWPSKRVKTTSSIGFVPDTPVDKVVKNDPQRVDRVVERLREELSYWGKSIIPDIGKTGRLETMIKTWMLRIVRAALGVPLDAQWSPEELGYCKIDVSKDKVLNRLILLGRKKSSSSVPHPAIVEAVINCSSLHFKIWQIYMNSANAKGSISNRFDPLYRLIRFWDKIINNWYAIYHDNVKRDSMLAFVCSGASSLFKHSRVPLCYECDDQCMGIYYPEETVNDQRISDYVVKLFLELVLSPHIDIEWKLEMSKYLTSKGIAMVSQAFGAEECSSSSSETMTGETGPFQPCAARFWDFCKSERPPRSVEYALITPEPSSMPCLSSGAGVFGSINVACSCPKVADSIPFKALTVLTKLKKPSTRRWIEEGSVLMFNMYPLTVLNAPVGYGRRIITNWKFKSSFVSSIISSIVSSRRRKRNAHDKGSRSSDLLSEGNGMCIKTVLFNCKSELDDVSGNRMFDKTLSFEGDLLGGAVTKQQLEKCGSFNPSTGEAVIYSGNSSKSKQKVNSETDLEYLGVITTVSDAVVTDFSIANPKYKGIVEVNKNIVSFSDKSADVCVKIDSLLIRPSEAIERIVRRSAVDLKRHYTLFLNNPAKNASTFREALNANVQTASTVGVTVRTDDDDKMYTFYNKKASMGFNMFNSHPLSIEAHTDADVMILMAIFLKQNSLWHNKGGLMYDQFDYTTMFFRRDKATDTPFFVYELASCIPVREAEDNGKKRKAEANKSSINFEAAKNLIGLQLANRRCKHKPTASYIDLYSDGRQPYCVSCFCSMFFVASGTVRFKDKKGLQEWINGANERCADIRLVEHLNALSSIECSSKIEHDYKFWNLINSLDVRRKKMLPAMDTSLLFANMNPFGKMLLVMMQNCFIMTEKGKVEGKWFDLDYMGPNLWKFQITSYREEKFDTFVDMACIETLRRLPMEGEPIVSRMVFKTYCRGENLSLAYEVVSDVAQTINSMRMNTEGRKFFFEDGKLCSSAEASDEVLLSLEVTGYRPNRAQNNMNSNRVSARVMRILGSREGARAWKKREREEDCILIEDLSASNASYEAMERMSNLNKIFYYDIETNTNKCSTSDAIITSICGSLCTGGDVNGGERVIFALAAGVKPEDLVRCIREEYSCQGDMITDYPPEKVYAFSTEYELLLAFSEYMREAKPHVFCGWNSKRFDDPFVFYRMVQYLKHDKDPKKRAALASNNGLFNFEPFMTTKEGHGGPVLCEAFYGDASAAAAAHDNMSYMDHRKGQGGGIDINAILGGCCKIVRLDMKEVCAKAYENLAEYNLNAVLVKVSKVGDKMAILKDPIDIAKQLLGYLSLKTAKEQAPVHKYCSKDAYVVGIVDISTNKGGEMRRLCYDSTLIESVVTANMPTPLCISDGAICRAMGQKRALKKGSGIRKHSMATETKGGMVSQPIVDSVCLQTVDMSSLYPSTMCQYNLCTSTFVTHMQVINLRDRMAMKYLAGADDVLEAVDRANAYVLDRYRPIDIVVKSWRIDSTDRVKRTQLEKKLNVFWNETKNDGSHREWCRDKPPSFSITAAGMEYFPEYSCSLDLQRAANVNDDMHINPSDLEYMVPALVAMALEDAGLAAHVTCGTCTTTEGLLAMLDDDFDRETDEKIKERLYSYVGTDSDPDWAVDHAFDRIASVAKAVPAHSLAVVDLLDRILRRVNAFDSTNDNVLKKWAARMINVGSFVRAWNTKKDVLKGVIPVLQADYKASRTTMQQKAKMYAATDPKKAEFNKVGEKTTKLSMNSIYGCLGLRANQSRKSVGASAETGVGGREGGAGGGTRHSPTANQITSVSRCVFGNIACVIQQALPNAKQVYGDTDSVFCNHNIPGDGGGRSLFALDGRLVYRIDTVMKNKIASFLPLFINAAAKGIKFDEKRDAGVPFMKIAHERLAFLVFLFAKKTYHMIHLKEGSKGSDAILKCKEENIDKFSRVIDCPEEYKDYVVAHNPTLILAAAANDENLNNFLRKEGATDRESLKAWFTTSDRWLEMDANTLYSMYASRMLDVENGNWIDWRTSRLIERGTELYEGVTQAAEAFTLYRKGAFVKRGIPSSTKLKSLQSLFIRNLPRHLFDRAREYRNGIEHHVRNCASFEASPFMSITSSRVNKYKTDEKQKLPNPMAMVLNNHIHPNDPVLPAEKFLTVTVASAWAISGDKSHGSVPTGYFNNKSVKWDAEMMRGLVPGSVVKSLSVVPNTIRTVMEMVRSDAKNIESVIEECVVTLATASTGTSGFSLKKRALCFNTGILCSDTLVRAVLSGKAWPANEEETIAEKEEGNNIEEEEGLIPLKSSPKLSLERIRERILNCMVYDDVIFNKNVDPNTLDLKGLMCDKLRVDDRVYEQLCNLVDQMTTSKDMTMKKGKERISALDEMIAAVEIDFDRVVDICADRMVQHCRKCPVIMPDDKNDCLFKKVLDLLAGKVKCTATCVNATCQSLDFVLLCTLALREVNRRRRTDEFDVSMADYTTDEMVKVAFGPRYNRELDAVVFLFDEPAAPMSKTRIDKRIRDGASSLTTGAVYNPDDGRFFGGLMDRDGMIEESLLQGGSVVELPFVTGVYYREAVELAVSRLCENRGLRGLLTEAFSFE